MQRPVTKELLLNVLQSPVLNVTDRLHMGLTCRQAWELALPLVWGEWIPFHAISNLLPSDLTVQPGDGRAYGLSRSLRFEDFERFEYYKPYIRRLSLSDGSRYRLQDEMLLAVLILDQYFGKTQLFAQVTHLVLDFRLACVSTAWDVAREICARVIERHVDASHVSHIFLLLPGLKLAAKSREEQLTNNPTIGLGKILDCMASFRNLKDLSLSCDDDINETALNNLLSVLPHFISLKRVSICPDIDAELLLPSLAKLPYLESLVVESALLDPEELEDRPSDSDISFPSIKSLTISNAFTMPISLTQRVSSRSLTAFSTYVPDASCLPHLTKSIIDNGWQSSLKYLHLEFRPTEWYSIKSLACCHALSTLSITASLAAVSETPLDLITRDFDTLEAILLDVGPDDMAIKSSSRLELPISQFCSLVSRCPQLRYIHVPFSLDFPRGLLPDARLVVPKLQYLFAEGLNCSDMASAKAYIPLNLPKLDRVLATGIDNKVQEVLDDLRITFNFPDADTLADLRLQLAGDEQPLRRQVLRSLFRRPKKRYLRAKPVRRELITIKQERTDETLFDDQPEDQVLEIRLTDLELPILVEPPPSPRTILSASDIPSAFRSSVSSLSEESPPSATSIYVSD